MPRDRAIIRQNDLQRNDGVTVEYQTMIKRRQINNLECGEDFQSAVSRICNPQAQRVAKRSRLETGDKAGWKPALRRKLGYGRNFLFVALLVCLASATLGLDLEQLKSQAEAGDVQSQFILGQMFYEGRTVAKDYKQAEKWLRPAAEKNLPIAQLFLGKILSNSSYQSQDDIEAFKWMLKAAGNDVTEAQFSLGAMYEKGQGVERDSAEAAKWYRKAADKKHAEAQFKVGETYLSATNYVEAAKWFQKAAAQNHPRAQFKLGNFYYDGTGVTQDPIIAARWFRKAGEQGVSEAQFNLGLMYVKGVGVKQNLVESYAWFTLASRSGSRIALDNREALAEKLTPEQIVEAHNLADRLADTLPKL